MTENKKTILIIEDDTFLLDMYTIKFKEQGFSVDTSNSGENALEKLRGGTNPDVILFDVVMPGVDGLELLETIRNENLAKNSLLVAISNQGEKTDIEAAKVRGVHEYIVKANTIPSEVVDKVTQFVKDKAKK